MFRSIVRAMSAALRAMLRLVDGVWTFVFGSGGGGDVIIDDDDGEPAPAAQAETEPYSLADSDLLLAQRRNAALVFTYAAAAQVDGVRPQMPPAMSRAVREWLPGLTVYDLRALTDAGVDGIRAHLYDGPYITGIHRVNPLPPVALEKIPEHDPAEEIVLWKTSTAPRGVDYLRDLLARESLSR
jgi:hypothetical protein